MNLMLVLALNVILFYSARTHDIWRSIVAAMWVILVTIGTTRAFRRLQTLEPRTELAKLAFQLAMIQPIIGTVPVILLLLP